MGPYTVLPAALSFPPSEGVLTVSHMVSLTLCVERTARSRRLGEVYSSLKRRAKEASESIVLFSVSNLIQCPVR